MDIHAHQSLGADNLPTGGMISLANEQEVVRRAGRQAISAFLDSHNCFSVLRASGKVVVFDTRIPIQLAFYALVEHGAWNKRVGKQSPPFRHCVDTKTQTPITDIFLSFPFSFGWQQICKPHHCGIQPFVNSWDF